MRLDKNQRKAIQHFKGAALVVAGPGTGKTTVITERILNLIRVHNVPPSQIVAIAFNKKAVGEIENRVLAGLGKKAPDVPNIRTLHAFGKDIIVENYRLAGFKRKPENWTKELRKVIATERKELERETSTAQIAIYKIESQTTGRCYIGQSTNPKRRKKEHFCYSSNDRLRQAIRSEGASGFSFDILEWVPGRYANRRESHWIGVYKKQCRAFNRGEPLRQRFSNQVMIEMFCQYFRIRYRKGFDRRPDFEFLLKRFNELKSEVRRAKRDVKTGSFEPKTIDNLVVREFAKKYEAKKAEANAIDFEDMIIGSANLLESYPDIRQKYQDRYRYVLVDEFQDISPADFRLISQLSENLFAVGDDDQAIYAFRGGASQIMLEFVARRDVVKYEVTRNYRSTSTLVEHARALIEHNAPRIKKNLRAHNPRQCRINCVETKPERVKECLHQELREAQEVAILARTNDEIGKTRALLPPDTEVEVTTIHNAKGREWDKVILIHNIFGKSLPLGNNDIREERRVCYVAMTRAKRNLVFLGGKCEFIPEFQKVRKDFGYWWRQFRYWLARRALKKEEQAK